MISITRSTVRHALDRASYSMRVKAAGVVARRALRQLARTAPWQEIPVDADLRIRFWGQIENACARAGRRFNVSGEVVIASLPEVSLLRAVMAQREKAQPVILPLLFVGLRQL